LARRETTEADLAQVDGYATADFTAAEKAVLRFTEAFYRDHRSVADDVWDELKRHYTEPEVLEIAWTVATYIMFGKLIYAFEVPFGADPGHPADRHTS
jgi:alkylhydroperoxidase family enzyme